MKNVKLAIIGILTCLAFMGCSDNALDPPNLSPNIGSIITSSPLTDFRIPVVLYCLAYDLEFDPLSYSWSCTSGNFTGSTTNDTVLWHGSKPNGNDTLSSTIRLTVFDGHSSTQDSVIVRVVNGDLYYDTGEPFIDSPDGVTGLYNGQWDQGEIFIDLPSSHTNPALGDSIYEPPTLNVAYDSPNGYFDEYELFTKFGNTSIDPSQPVIYTYDLTAHGADWPAWQTELWLFDPQHSTWTDRNADGLFEPPW